MNFRKNFPFLLSGAMLAGVLPCSVSAAENDLFSYSLLSDGTAAVKCNDASVTSVNIPLSVDGRTVTALAEGCFAGFENLESVTIPDTITAIGSEAFAGCSAMTVMEIPASVQSIGLYAFDTMENLTEFRVAEDNPNFTQENGMLFDKAETMLIKYPEGKTDIACTLPETCVEIADWAFVGSQYLESIDLQNVQTIGEDAFYYCVHLKSIDIPEGVTELTGAAFGNCADLEKITLPSTLEKIGDDCFFSCVSLRDVKLPEGLTDIGEKAFFHCLSLKSLTIPKSLTNVRSEFAGYYYDADAEAEAVQEDFILYVNRGTSVKEYAKSNGISYKIMTDYEEILKPLIVLLFAVAAVLLVCVIAVLMKRRKAE